MHFGMRSISVACKDFVDLSAMSTCPQLYKIVHLMEKESLKVGPEVFKWGCNSGQILTSRLTSHAYR